MVEGLLPNGWKKTALESLAVVQTGIAKGKQTSGETATLPYLRVANVQDGHVDLSVVKEITLKVGEIARYSLRTGDVLFTEGGDFDKLGRGTVWNGQIAPCLHQNHVFAVRPHPNLLSGEFLAFQASSHYGRKFFQLSSKQSTNLASINSTQLKKFPILHPPLPEQRKIAEILRTWDDALENLTALRKAKARRFEGLRSGLFALSAASQNSENIPLASLARIRKGQQLNKLDISSGIYPVWNGGLSPSGFHDEWNTESGTITISEGGNSCGFINLAVDRFWLGGHCYALDDLSERIERDFLFHLLKAREKEVMRLRVGSGLPNIQRTDLERLQIIVPPLNLQHQIANSLNTAKNEITLLDAEITALNRQKRGLMQKLLTGEWRVQV